MLFIRHRKSLDPFYDEYAEVYYVDGTYVTSVVAFLIFAAVAIPALALFGVVRWLCDHMMLLYVLYAVGVVILIIMQSRHTRKKYMFFYALSTLTMLVIPITATIAYIFPIMVFGETAKRRTQRHFFISALLRRCFYDILDKQNHQKRYCLLFCFAYILSCCTPHFVRIYQRRCRSYEKI